MLATILFHLTQNKEARTRLLHDMCAAPPTADDNRKLDVPFFARVRQEGAASGDGEPCETDASYAA